MGGENIPAKFRPSQEQASSPHGRGKHRCGLTRRRSRGFIPAWAGKTGHRLATHDQPPAHPRVDGENQDPARWVAHHGGSSPRGRGKRTARARASIAIRAHPRAGGENESAPGRSVWLMGSSPRGRGKHVHAFFQHVHERLIPARAGKTSRKTAASSTSWAHPRAGGENDVMRRVDAPLTGSSPRGRGKRRRRSRPDVDPRLIPARAGKTTATKPTRCRSTAHPRAGGENVRRLA